MNPTNQISNSTRLKITNLPDDDLVMALDLIIRDILSITQIYHLDIREKIYVI